MKRLKSVGHDTFLKGLDGNWKVDAEGGVKAHSICWLFCWAKTGMGSSDAADAARKAFDRILDVPYSEFDKAVDHEWARKWLTDQLVQGRLWEDRF